MLSAGYQHSIALTAAGHVLTWGIGENGQLGRISISLRHPKAFEGAPWSLHATSSRSRHQVRGIILLVHTWLQCWPAI